MKSGCKREWSEHAKFKVTFLTYTRLDDPTTETKQELRPQWEATPTSMQNTAKTVNYGAQKHKNDENRRKPNYGPEMHKQDTKYPAQVRGTITEQPRSTLQSKTYETTTNNNKQEHRDSSQQNINEMPAALSSYDLICQSIKKRGRKKAKKNGS